MGFDPGERAEIERQWRIWRQLLALYDDIASTGGYYEDADLTPELIDGCFWEYAESQQWFDGVLLPEPRELQRAALVALIVMGDARCGGVFDPGDEVMRAAGGSLAQTRALDPDDDALLQCARAMIGAALVHDPPASGNHADLVNRAVRDHLAGRLERLR
jgi:hypothetical protein